MLDDNVLLELDEPEPELVLVLALAPVLKLEPELELEPDEVLLPEPVLYTELSAAIITPELLWPEAAPVLPVPAAAFIVCTLPFCIHAPLAST